MQLAHSIKIEGQLLAINEEGAVAHAAPFSINLPPTEAAFDAAKAHILQGCSDFCKAHGIADVALDEA
ncbi:MAG: hypothetical protein QOJ65_1208 [Fimbriimonadaceae bacterium]|jgi:hypothetical protein|nr:hypothetical protein [Fimbriimonadaceae bacterium]